MNHVKFLQAPSSSSRPRKKLDILKREQVTVTFFLGGADIDFFTQNNCGSRDCATVSYMASFVSLLHYRRRMEKYCSINLDKK